MRESGEFGDGAETGMAREESLERGFEDEAAVERHLWRDDETLEMMKEREELGWGFWVWDEEERQRGLLKGRWCSFIRRGLGFRVLAFGVRF